MTNVFATDPERACYAIWTMWAVSWFLAAAWSSRPQSRASIAQQLPYRILTIAGFVLLFAVRTNRYHGPLRLWTLPTSAGWMMVLLCAMGFGFIAAAIALALVKGTVIALAGALLAAFGFWVKARLEEGFLSEKLGAEAYDSYRRRVPMLVPFGSA